MPVNYCFSKHGRNSPSLTFNLNIVSGVSLKNLVIEIKLLRNGNGRVYTIGPFRSKLIKIPRFRVLLEPSIFKHF